MSFLPVVERELRVAARKKHTFILRVGTALLGALICGPVFLMAVAAAMMSSSPNATIGLYTFKILSHYTYALCLLAGVFLAADCLSEERREGTLGFLFLTDLKGYDVVLGKFAGISLNAFYALLAVFPVLALPLLIGGVTGGEFWRTILALVNALFFSVAVGVGISSFARSSAQAMAVTLFQLVMFGVLLPCAQSIVGGLSATHNILYYLGLCSPYQPMSYASDTGFKHLAAAYWSSVAVSHLLGWLFLALACWHLPRSLETKAVSRGKGFWTRFFSGDLLAGARKRKMELMERNPILWLLADSARMRGLAWFLSGLGCATLLLVMLFGNGPTGLLSFVSALPFYFLLKILFAIQSCRFFSEARRTGSLELLCCTPLTNNLIIRGQWQALRRIFLWPALVLVLTNSVAAVLAADMDVLSRIFGSAVTIFFLVGSVADFFAIGWFGMWLALAGKKPGTAAGFTILFVLLLPTIASFCIPTLLVDVVFIAVARAKLQMDFRVLASGQRQAYSVKLI